MRTTGGNGNSRPGSSDRPLDAVRDEPDETACPVCSGPLETIRTRHGTVSTILRGPHRAKAVERHCPNHPDIVCRSPRIRRVRPSKSRYGWDLHLGTTMLHYERGRSFAAIRRHYESEFSLSIPRTTLQGLARRGLTFLQMLHDEETAAIGELLLAEGGYFLLLDGTRRQGSATLLVVSALPVGVRLSAALVRTESREECVRFLKGLKARYPAPLGILRDMGEGLAQAAREVYPGVPQWVCHEHLLEAVHRHCFEKTHPEVDSLLRSLGIRARLREVSEEVRAALGRADDLLALWPAIRSGNGLERVPRARREAILTTTLVGWVLEGDRGEREQAFPHGLPVHAVVDRCRQGLGLAREYRRILARDLRASGPLLRVEQILARVEGEGEVARRVREIMAEDAWLRKFCDGIRAWLGFGPRRTLVPDVVAWRQEEVTRRAGSLWSYLAEKEAEVATLSADSRRQRTVASVRKLLESQRPYLFGANPVVDAGAGPVELLVPRTTNVLESQIWELSRQVGRAQGGRARWESVEWAGPGLFLLPNLRNEAYLLAVTGGTGNLLGRLADLGSEEAWSREEAERACRLGAQAVMVPRHGRREVLGQGERLLATEA